MRVKIENVTFVFFLALLLLGLITLFEFLGCLAFLGTIVLCDYFFSLSKDNSDLERIVIGMMESGMPNKSKINQKLLNVIVSSGKYKGQTLALWLVQRGDLVWLLQSGLNISAKTLTHNNFRLAKMLISLEEHGHQLLHKNMNQGAQLSSLFRLDEQMMFGLLGTAAGRSVLRTYIHSESGWSGLSDLMDIEDDDQLATQIALISSYGINSKSSTELRKQTANPTVKKDMIYLTQTNRQSTHEGKVMQSAEDSVRKLYKKYGKKDSLQEQKWMQECFAWLSKEVVGKKVGLLVGNEDLRKSAIRRCAARLCRPSGADRTVQLVLCCILEALRQGTGLCQGVCIEDAKERLVDAFYLIQRGYNIQTNDQGNDYDDGRCDLIICPPGTINQLVNSMISVLPECSIDHTGPATLSSDFHSAVRDLFEAYLQRHGCQDNSVFSDDGQTLKKDFFIKELKVPVFKQLRAKYREGGFPSEQESNLESSVEYITVDDIIPKYLKTP